MKFLITGGRDYRPTPEDEEWYLDLLHELQPTEVHHGAARGADAWAGMVAARNGFRVVEHPADWKRHGRAAGPIRNKEMAALMFPVDKLVRFPGGKGTEDMTVRALLVGMEVLRSPSYWPEKPAERGGL